MAQVICAIAGGKGGVGRTSVALNLGATLDQYGYDTVVVDADLQMSDFGTMLDVDVDPGLHSVLAGEATVGSALVEVPGGMRVLPGERSIEAFADADASKLGDVLEMLGEFADVVLVDTGTNFSHATVVSFGSADGILLVTTPDELSVRDATHMEELADHVDSDVVGAIVTRARGRRDVESVNEAVDVPVLGGVPFDPVVSGEDEPVTVTALDSDVAKAYSELGSGFQDLLLSDSPTSIEPAFEDDWVDDGARAGVTPATGHRPERVRSDGSMATTDRSEDATGQVDAAHAVEAAGSAETAREADAAGSDDTQGGRDEAAVSDGRPPADGTSVGAPDDEDDGSDEDGTEDDDPEFTGGALPFG